MWNEEWDLMIFVGPFQHGVFHDFVTNDQEGILQ